MSLPDSIAIRVNGISKSYDIAHLQETESTRKANQQTRRWPWARGRSKTQTLTRETFWALRDISFDVPTGQVLGIIGRNGAGKSTFLKILSQIIEPSQGFADIRGRVGSLLEVGTGFHPELTGRENIYLNGTLLGMRRRQINNIFDQIVDFAEVERFIDTPVKRYSSGMYVRLAFAVAAHLQPDVLIIDEVLSVGDASFQEKCLGRMQSLGDAGRTVIFVSHNMDAVAALCDRALVFHEGRIHFDGTPQAAADAYYELCAPSPNENLEYRERGGSQPDIISAISCDYKQEDPVSNQLEAKVLVTISGSLESLASTERGALRLAIGVNHESGYRLGTYVATEDDEELRATAGRFSYTLAIQNPPLQAGKYWLDVSLLKRGETLDSLQRCGSFRIPQSSAKHYQNPEPGWGAVRLHCQGYNENQLAGGPD